MISESSSLSVATELADRIKLARVKARLSQEQLANLASISRRPVYLLESGRGTVRLDTLIKILDVLGLELKIVAKGANFD
jgi:HTH-type transcriptional regulator / antitoxin HipB